MPSAPHLDVTKRHDFVLFFDVTDGNPNGDPDAGNLPRVDPETMHGLVTDVAIKRKVRDYVHISRGTEAPFKIYVLGGGPALNTLHKRAREEALIELTEGKQRKEDVDKARERIVDKARERMCQKYYDIRMFGAVMTTRENCGQVRGPLQLTFARSIDPIVPLDLSITRVVVTREEDMKVEVSESGEAKGKQTEMGRKAMVPYGLYRAHGFFNPHFASQTGVTEEDLALFWEALGNMWDQDRSASRGLMACQGLYIFTHASNLGNAPAYQLFRRVRAALRPGVSAPRSRDDYDIDVDDSQLPAGVTLTRLYE